MGAYKDEKKGTWNAKFSYQDYTGKTRWTTKRGFKTKREALEYEREFLMQKAGDVDMTFAAFVKIYEETVFPRQKLSTTVGKKYTIDRHIIPYFGNKKLSEISKKDVLAWQNELIQATNPKSGKPYAKATLSVIHNQLSAILTFAVKNYGLSENVAAKVGNMGSVGEVRNDFWTEDEYRLFIEQIMVKPITYYAMETLYWTGMRSGELLALSLEDIDFEKKTIRINKTYYRRNGVDHISSPKTKTSKRTIAMPDFLAEELKEYVEKMYKSKPTDRLFPLSKHQLAYALDKGAEMAGVKRIRIHDLRHSHVSLLISLGYGAVEIGARVGHSAKEITYRYAHLFPDTQSQMAATLDKLNDREAKNGGEE